jgi:methylated-DNA-[protein]-cysteine S-methyltransferase
MLPGLICSQGKRRLACGPAQVSFSPELSNGGPGVRMRPSICGRPPDIEVHHEQLQIFIEHVPTPIGTMLVLSDEQDRLRASDWEDHESRMHRLLRLHYGAGRTRLEATSRVSAARRAIEAYLAGELSAIDSLQVETGGTAFQREVWAALRAIPAGQTITYGRLAARLGRPKAVRAVGLANGANPVGVVVPCHRVIGANASLTGYRGGIERKRWLLQHESAARLERRCAEFA